ncbi:hypothetical protein A5747_13625 [Mycobacterium sp. IS-836]|uniref:hypothetical protein n=1 Tax=Mycobacterium sp. IS-836 TaxID=1834160 RepID=UPI00096CCA17|nr:hypothetical protein [Mycobacterium sp. IS-836]OMC55423.1 hypothetical protein A5747_13625 [Mycobacterium sp. IS-836]
MSGGYDMAIYKRTEDGHYKRASGLTFVEFHFDDDNVLRPVADPGFSIQEKFRNHELFIGWHRGGRLLSLQPVEQAGHKWWLNKLDGVTVLGLKMTVHVGAAVG